MTYPHVDPQPNFPAIESKTLEFWQGDGTFAASIEQHPSTGDASNEFVFYDGPPFANGLPHYGHLLTGFVKDAVPRYQTMRGKRVERRFGWDCHGLPAEAEAERQLGISGTQAITDYGIDKFNEYRKVSVSNTPLIGSDTSLDKLAGLISPTITKLSICRTWKVSCGRLRRCGTRV